LLDENFNYKKETNIKYEGTPLFVSLKNVVPSFFLLKYLFNYGNFLQEYSYNRALKFTYGKNLELINEKNKIINRAKQNYDINDDSLFIFIYNEKKVDKDLILGICKIKDNKIINVFNIGEYLHEN